jgi:hypothetical protein
VRARSKPGCARNGGTTRCTAVGALLAGVVLIAAPVARAAFQPADLRVDGGEDSWHAQRLFALRWANPPGTAAVHYRVLSPSGDVVVGPTTLAWPATSIQHVSVPPLPGVYTAEVWLEDGTGTEGPRAAGRLRFDDARPGDVAPASAGGWIGRTAFPYRLRIGQPQGPQPISGIRGYAVSIDRSPNGNPCAGETCSEAETDLRGGIAMDTLSVDELAEGVDYVHAVAVSGSGVPSAVPGNAVLRVDETDPGVRLEGSSGGWSNRPLTLTATASDSASGMALGGSGSPFTAIGVDGGPPAVAGGDAATATVIGSGVHSVAYYARDAAGNVADGGVSNGRPNHQPATATVRIDREPPQLAFAAAQDPLDPERIEARAADRYAGIDPARGSISIRRAGSGERFAKLPTELSVGLLHARWDSAAYPAGEYEFRATAYDRAGNAATTTSRAGGAPMRLSGPLKVPVTLLTKTRPRTLRYGRGAWFGGRLIAARRTPLAGIEVHVVERFSAGGRPSERTSTARTDGRGEFGLHLPPGPSREVIATVVPTATLRGTSSPPLTLSVRAHVGLRVSSRVARVGGAPLVFRGKVADDGAAIPAGGKTVQLQFRLQGTPWGEFRTIRTGPEGRFRYAYRFADDDSRGVRFQFRAYAPAQAGWPFEPAGSRPVAVLGI